jgi:GNAT superfamily N-acetyltransferase
MFVEQLSRDNIDEYIQLLSPDEIFGTELERYTSFGAYDEESGEVLGTISLEVLADYISIKSIYTAPEHRNKGVGTALIDFVKNAPGVDKFPLCMITDDECSFLQNRGFTKEESRYTIADGKLGNLERPRLEGTVRKGNIIRYLDEVERDVIEDFVETSPHDDFIQFPDMAVDPRRFSEGSLVCFKNGEVTGALLMEEPEDYIQITWAYAASQEVMMLMLSVIKTELDMEYETRKHIRFLQCDKSTSDVVEKVFHESEIRPINIFRSHVGG